MEKTYIQMFGGLALSTETSQISDRDNRSKKVWLLIAYLICHRHRVLTQDELVNILWRDDEQERGANPAGALKTIIHRARTTLDALWPRAGSELILRKGSGYGWNAEAPIELDTEQFDRLCIKGDCTEENVEEAFTALQMYQGDFLASMSSEVWVMSSAAYYHNCYVDTMLKVIPVLMEQQRYAEVVDLCQAVTHIEPYHEPLHGCLMRALLARDDRKGAAEVYRKLSDRLFNNLGILPSDELRELYRRATRTQNNCAITIDVLCQQIAEGSEDTGALVCEYDFFRILCRAMSRSMARTGSATHIGLISVSGRYGAELTRRKLDGAMNKLEERVRMSLRRGDAAAQCSVSQYVILLPRANYENSCKVCERVIQSFYHKNPHSDADIQYVVYPLQPDEQEAAKWSQLSIQN